MKKLKKRIKEGLKQLPKEQLDNLNNIAKQYEKNLKNKKIVLDNKKQ